MVVVDVDMDVSSGCLLLSKALIAVASSTVLLHCFIVTGFVHSFSSQKMTSSGRTVCSSDRDCDGATGEVCWWLYKGCSSGQCMCNPRTHIADTVTGKCVVVRRSNEPCGENDTCADSLACINGTCRCSHVHSSSLPLFDGTDDWYGGGGGQPCLQSNYKFLGRPCRSASDVCYHETAYGYTSNEVECNVRTSTCTCREGYKQDGRTCRRLHIWEVGCRKDFHCEGGAVCVDEQCACPTGYRSVAGNTKCAKIGAVLELPIRGHCDEINERGYCAQGLVCHRCHDTDSRPICARYTSGYEPDQSPYVSHSTRQLIDGQLPFSLALILTFLHSAVFR